MFSDVSPPIWPKLKDAAEVALLREAAAIARSAVGLDLSRGMLAPAATVCDVGRSTLANVVLTVPNVATLSTPLGAVLLVQLALFVQVPLPFTPHCESTSAGLGT
jgi:hypothetical protein